ncbi:hypothetical protein E1B28_006655 [Marasmius oreades]|uniref:Uncharacterized protein n=1 Tax=Marasmius oreades TaxID=181124 RepID=A0A9P7UWK4_9AGAR|nr:uncharacterized protein E1B28_006655 [Marasmius oreades]KAG7095972.1 hypothetical protein E1B28_006655 [Marasmius oreades]
MVAASVDTSATSQADEEAQEPFREVRMPQRRKVNNSSNKRVADLFDEGVDAGLGNDSNNGLNYVASNSTAITTTIYL